MAIDYDLDSVPGIAMGIAHGTLTLQEIKEIGAAMWSRVAMRIEPIQALREE